MVARLTVNGEAASIPDSDDNVTIDDDNEDLERVTVDGGTEIVWQRDTGGVTPITATILYSPSAVPDTAVNNNTGTKASNEPTKNIQVNNITGGDGGPYTVDFTNVVGAFRPEETCPGSIFRTGTIIKSYSGDTGASNSAVRTNVPANQSGVTLLVGQMNFTAPLPIFSTAFGFAQIDYSGSLTITDGSSNTVTINLNHLDSYNWGNTTCTPN